MLKERTRQQEEGVRKYTLSCPINGRTSTDDVSIIFVRHEARYGIVPLDRSYCVNPKTAYRPNL